MTINSRNHLFRIAFRLGILLVILFGWLWLADRFFNGLTTDFSVTYEYGVLAIAEQGGVSLYTPALLFWKISSLDDNIELCGITLFLVCILQLWPTFVLAFMPWNRLSSITRWIIGLYCSLCFIAILWSFIFFHSSWQQFFGP